jgi:flagellar basal body rod protein FlgG
MVSILGAASGGLEYGQALIDTVGHNLANVNTFGFKRTRVLAEGMPISSTLPGISARSGVAELTVDRIFAPGFAQATNDPLQFGITDDAFFRVQNVDGASVMTRDGALSTDGQGNVISSTGLLLVPPISIPPGYSQPSIDVNGVVTAADAAGTKQEVGRIGLVRYTSPQTLLALGGGLYEETVNSGTPVTGFPGDGTFAQIVPGSVEGSNVDVATEFANLLIAQRAYQASAKTFGVADTMQAIASNLTK